MFFFKWTASESTCLRSISISPGASAVLNSFFCSACLFPVALLLVIVGESCPRGMIFSHCFGGCGPPPFLSLIWLVWALYPRPCFLRPPPPFLTQGPHRNFFCHRHLEAPAPSGRDAVAPDRPAGGRAGGRWGVGCPSGGCYPPLTLHAPSTLCATGDMYASPQRSLTWQDCLCIFGPVTRDLGWVVGVNQVTPKSNHPTPDS